MAVVHKIGTANTAGGSITSTPQSSVFVNGVEICVDGSIGTSHAPCPAPPIHCAGSWSTANGCTTVFAENIPVNRAGDRDTCEHPRADISGNVYICAFNGAGTMIDHNPPYFGNPDDPTNPVIPVPSGGQPTPQPSFEDVTKADVAIYDDNHDDPDGTIPASPPSNTETKFGTKEIDRDSTPSPAIGSPVPFADCSTFEALSPSFTWTSVSGSFTAYATSTLLSTNYTVADLSISTAVSRYEFTSSVTQASGATQKTILLNMCFHANTVLEAMRADGNVPSFTITSAFRNKSGGSQHNRGQATDLQFLSFHGSGSTGRQYFELAKYIRDTFDYDQMILEWFGRNPWIHISTNSSGHRRNVLTQVSRNSYAPGLRLLG